VKEYSKTIKEVLETLNVDPKAHHSKYKTIKISMERIHSYKKKANQSFI
jgi:hypothetical protein